MTSIPIAKLLEIDAVGLQEMMQSGDLTSVQLVKTVLAQIQAEDRQGACLNAMISTAPENDLLIQAEQLDSERRQGKLRGPLHGIPIIVKDAINTDPSLGMKTTCGSWALMNARVSRSASVIVQLLKAGALILGKSNMTEFCNFKGVSTPSGWSAVKGQVLSAYVRQKPRHDQGRIGPTQPGGSSTGSAVGVAAGYAPIALGTETDGSCIQPATRAALFSIKTTPGSIPLDGTWLGSSTFDNICPMAKSVSDLAAATEVLLNEAARNALPADGFSSSLVKNFHNMTVGFVDPEKWRLPDVLFAPDAKIRSEMDDAYFDARHNVSVHGGTVVKDVSLISPSELQINGTSDIGTVIGFELRNNIDRYLGELSESEVRNLPELIDWIEQHKEQELPKEAPDQDRLINALQDVPSQERYEKAVAHMHKISREDGIDKTMRKHDLDVVVMPTESAICSIAAAAGYPIATMPLGYLSEYEKPFGLSIMARAGEEQVLFKFMSAWETISPRRMTPSKLEVAKLPEEASLL